jgi:GNAT superfamily N-acetyltransferase
MKKLQRRFAPTPAALLRNQWPVCSGITGRFHRNTQLGRLAVDLEFQGRGLGRALLRDAVLRSLQAAHIIGVRAILVHALSDEAKTFYESCGFVPSPVNPLTLMVTVAEAKKAFLSDQ